MMIKKVKYPIVNIFVFKVIESNKTGASKMSLREQVA